MRDESFVSRKEMLKYMVKLWSIMAVLLAIITTLFQVIIGGQLILNITIAIFPVYFIMLIGVSVYQKIVDNSSL